jgi:hypothetical protein
MMEVSTKPLRVVEEMAVNTGTAFSSAWRMDVKLMRPKPANAVVQRLHFMI